MSDTERESQLSAMFDGELPPSECELLARRLSRDESLRRSWGHYALIGAVMRGEPTTAAGLAPRVRAALGSPGQGATGESDRAVPSSVATGARRWLLPFSAVGAAATVAAVALFLVRTPAEESPMTAQTAIAELPAEVPAEDIVDQIIVASVDPVRTERGPAEPESYVTPRSQGSGGPLLGSDAELVHFMRAHSVVSPPMARHGALSSGVVVLEPSR